jgi:hypothetical protein
VHALVFHTPLLYAVLGSNEETGWEILLNGGYNSCLFGSQGSERDFIGGEGLIYFLYFTTFYFTFCTRII